MNKRIIVGLMILIVLVSGCTSTYNGSKQRMHTEVVNADGFIQRIYYYCDDRVTCYSDSGCIDMTTEKYNRFCG